MTSTGWWRRCWPMRWPMPGEGGLGHPRLHLRSTTSTNDRARELAIAGAPHGTLVTADEQTAGRGRQGRRWTAPAESALLMSLVLRGAPEPLSLLAGVAVCDAVGEGARVKWPNDVVLESGPEHQPALRKLAGILVEGRPQDGWAVLGIGVNVAVRLQDMPDELRATAATLGLQPNAIESVLVKLLAAIGRRLSTPVDQTLDEWRALDALRGREVSWRSGRDSGSDDGRGHGDGQCGRAEGIDETGRLIVVQSDGRRVALDGGEVHLRGGGLVPS
jgi:BirA family transcriptional regulator, biotin operon repressor / biotin---[acetyl-CoA-carboxylase] ligase